MAKGLDRVMTRVDVLALAFGAMIGWGWVVLTGPMIAKAGSLGVLLALAIGGGGCGLIGLIYAELTSTLTKSGSTVAFVFRGLSPGWAWVCGWSMILAYLAVSMFEAVALPSAASYVFPVLERYPLFALAGQEVYLPWVLLGSATSVVVAWLNYIGTKPAAVFQRATVLALAVVGVAFVAGSSVSGSSTNFAPLFTNQEGLVSALLMIPFLFVGFDVVPQMAEEMAVPARQVGKIIILSVMLAIVWYVLIYAGVSWVMPAGDRASSSLATADAMVRAFRSNLVGLVLVFGGVAGILSSWNAFFMGATRLIFTMARAEMLPSWLGRLHPRYGTPANAVLVVGLLNVLAPLAGKKALVWFVDAGGLAVVIPYLLVTLSFISLRRRRPDLVRPYRVPAGSLIGWMALIWSILLIFLYLPGSPSGLQWPFEWGIVGVWVTLGVIIHAIFYARHHPDVGRQRAELFGDTPC